MLSKTLWITLCEIHSIKTDNIGGYIIYSNNDNSLVHEPFIKK